LARNCTAHVIHADSTELRWAGSQFNLVVTSPPYMNSYDYYLYHKHRMIWLGLDYRFAQAKEFGSRNKHNDQGLGLDSYNEAIRNIAIRVNTILRPGAYFCVVVGDAILRGNLIIMNENYDGIFLSLGFNKVREISFD